MCCTAIHHSQPASVRSDRPLYCLLGWRQHPLFKCIAFGFRRVPARVLELPQTLLLLLLLSVLFAAILLEIVVRLFSQRGDSEGGFRKITLPVIGARVRAVACSLDHDPSPGASPARRLPSASVPAKDRPDERCARLPGRRRSPVAWRVRDGLAVVPRGALRAGLHQV